MKTHQQIQNIILEIRESVKRDIEPIIKGYLNHDYWIDKNVPGFWTIPRIIFPEIDGMGCFRYGRSSAENSIKFMDFYFPKFYQGKNDILINMYRHGLLHGHYPKNVVKEDNLYLFFVDWGSDTGKSDLHMQLTDEHLHVNTINLYHDFLDAIKRFSDEFKDTEKYNNLAPFFEMACEAIASPKEI